jgi:hypothetical protein
MIRAFFSIVAAAAAIARVLFVFPVSIIIFGRGFWRRYALSSKGGKERYIRKIRRENFAN